MAWPTANTPLAKAFLRADELMTTIKRVAASAAGRMASPMDADEVLSIHRSAVSFDTELGDIASVSGIVAYAKAQYDDPAFDVATEFNAVRAALQAVISEIETTIPTSSGFLLTHSFSANKREPRNFSIAQLATLKTLLETVDGTIV